MRLGALIQCLMSPGHAATALRPARRVRGMLLWLRPSHAPLVRRGQRIPSIVAVCALFAVGACSLLGPYEQRAEDFNLASAKYGAAAILYNMLRAGEAEPLDFVGLTGVTGHETATLGLGLPTIVVGPGRTAAQNLFLFGPNTVGASASNDYNISVVDDPASQAALLKPIDLATLGFFLNQRYNPGHIFFMFFSRLVYVDRNSGQVTAQYGNEPYIYTQSDDECARKGFKTGFGLDCTWQEGFYTKLSELLWIGLSIEVEPGFVPTQGGSGNARFCFDHATITDPARTARVSQAWLAALQKQNIVCRPGLVPASPAADQGQAVTGSIQQLSKPPAGLPKSFTVTAKIGTQGKDKTNQPELMFPDPTDSSRDVYVYTSSVYGAYRYLGEMLNLEKRNSIPPLPGNQGAWFNPGPDYAETRMLELTHDHSGCWSDVDYEGDHWCVPKGATLTKRTFQVLHQLFRLSTKPSNSPVTQTVRTVQ